MLTIHMSSCPEVSRITPVAGVDENLTFAPMASSPSSRQRGIGPSGIDEIPLALWRLTSTKH